jgi:hypothetical protein
MLLSQPSNDGAAELRFFAMKIVIAACEVGDVDATTLGGGNQLLGTRLGLDQLVDGALHDKRSPPHALGAREHRVPDVRAILLHRAKRRQNIGIDPIIARLSGIAGDLVVGVAVADDRRRLAKLTRQNIDAGAQIMV